MLLAHATWSEAERALARVPAMILPMGSTEQHGPLGLIGTDALTAEAVARGLGERVGLLVAPTIALGVAQFNLGFAGTLSLRASTVMALVEAVVLSMARHGVERVYVVNGHGGNIAPARAAFQDVYARWSLGALAGRAPRCRLRSWWEYPGVDALRKAWYGDAEGLHATPSEIALTLHLLPGSARQIPTETPQALAPGFVRDHAGDNHWDAASHRAAFPDGRVGSHSALATAQQGALLLQAAVDGACDDFEAFLAED